MLLLFFFSTARLFKSIYWWARHYNDGKNHNRWKSGHKCARRHKTRWINNKHQNQSVHVENHSNPYRKRRERIARNGKLKSNWRLFSIIIQLNSVLKLLSFHIFCRQKLREMKRRVFRYWPSNLINSFWEFLLLFRVDRLNWKFFLYSDFWALRS